MIIQFVFFKIGFAALLTRVASNTIMNTTYMTIKMTLLHKGHRAGLTRKGSIGLVIEHVVL